MTTGPAPITGKDWQNNVEPRIMAEDLRALEQGIQQALDGGVDVGQVVEDYLDAAVPPAVDAAVAPHIAQVEQIAGLTGEDEAVALLVGDPNSLTRGETDSLYARGGPLDIWPEYRRDGDGPDSWDGTTYADFIAGVDARLSGRGVHKEQIGTCTDGQPIWAYTFGRVGNLHALVLGGTHANESTSLFSAMRYFTEFVDNRQMTSRRDALRLTWVPTLVPSAYMATRYNSAGMDPNRDLDFFWEYWHGQDEHPQGATPMSQPSSVALKKLLDDYKIAAVVDCHTGHGGMSWQGPSTWVLGNREIAHTAGAKWDQTYNASGAVALTGPYGLGNNGRPDITNWASKYMLGKGRDNAASLLIESLIQLGGSTSMSQLTREGARLYCGMVDTFLTEWLDNGQAGIGPFPRSTVAQRMNADHDVAIDEGGTLINVNPLHPIRFESPSTHIGGDAVNFLDLVAPGPGQLVVWGWASVRGHPDNTGLSMPRMRIGIGDSPVAGGNVPELSSTDVTTALSANVRGVLVTSHRMAVPEAKLIRAQLAFGNGAAATQRAQVDRCRLVVGWYPDTRLQPAPLIDVSSRM